MDDLLSEFISETRDTLDALAGELVAWEAEPDDRARLDSIFRFVHTVKGSCGFLDLPRLQRLSHAAEDVLAEVRAGKRQPDSTLVSAVLGIIDRIGELADAMATGDSLPDTEDVLLIAALAAGGAAEAPRVVSAKPAQPSRAVARSIRLPVDLLDRMMGGVSDMVLARNELARRLREGNAETSTEMAFERLSLCIAEMREAITKSRMARIDALFALLPRMVRDLAAELGKLVAVDIDGADVELDREMIEMIRDPLTHIVRNSIDHGIEPPEERKRAGKPPVGRLRISARQSGNQIVIEAGDDGRGINDEKLVQRAIAAGQLTAEAAAGMSRAKRLELIFAPGLSTASQVTEISGRGVGMDVVRANIERLGGAVEVDSRPGAGLRLAIRVPLTLTIIPALTVGSGGQQFAIPRAAIDEILRVGGAGVAIEYIGDCPVASIRGTLLPVLDLAEFLGLPTTGLGGVLTVLRAGGGERFVLALDAVHDHEELVVKPAAPELMATGLYAGTTLPDNSRPMLLLDVAGIAARAGIRALAAPAVEQEAEASSASVAPPMPTLLFRDLDGNERAVRLGLVERIEDVPRIAVHAAGGVTRVVQDGRLALLMASGPLPAEGAIRVLWLTDSVARLAYAIAGVIDAVDLPEESDGIVLSDGRPIALLDAYPLLARAGIGGGGAAGSALCLIADGEDRWSRQVLAPLLRAAGYRISFGGDAQASEAAIVIADVAHPPPPGPAAPVLRLRAAPEAGGPGDDSIYRYDRDGLLDAVRRRVAGGGS